jgi:uncharacterized membrane protein
VAEEEAVVINCLKNPQALAHQPAARSHPQKCHRQDLPAKSLQSQAAQAQELAEAAAAAAAVVAAAAAAAVAVAVAALELPCLLNLQEAAAQGQVPAGVEAAEQAEEEVEAEELDCPLHHQFP